MKTKLCLWESLCLIWLIILIGGCNSKKITNKVLEFKDVSELLADSLKTISSLKSVDEIYLLQYYGDYKKVLENENMQLQNNAKVACSIFSINNDSCSLLGRNLDLQFNLTNVLIGKYNPKNAYSSITLCALDFLVGNSKLKTDSLSAFSKQQILKVPFYVMDGINDQGLAVGIAALPSQKINPENNKEKIDVLLLNRLILDNAKNVDEAIEIAKKYDVFDADINTISHHYLVSDAEGNSVIIEYQNGKMEFIQDKKNYQIVTNSYVKDKSLQERNIHNRYLKIDEALEKENIYSVESAMEVLQKVSWQKEGNKGGTQWSVIYDLKNKTGVISIHGNYSNQYTFMLQ